MLVITKNLDRQPAYMLFAVQCTDPLGVKTSPTVDNLVIYETDGADAINLLAADEIANSPFDPVQLPTDAGKVGLWGLKIAKTNFSVGKYYLFVWEMTVDGKESAVGEIYFMTNAPPTRSEATADKDAIVSLIQYLAGKASYTIAAVAVPARKVEVGMLDTIDLYISATQKLHLELIYDDNKNVVDRDFTVI